MTHEDAPPGIRIRVRMTERATDEPYRVSSPLELLFDLTFVVAIAGLTAQLGHAVAAGHVLAELAPFLEVFFAIWWTWMNFTWFASSYDTDDVPYNGRAGDRGDPSGAVPMGARGLSAGC
jgi:low temperature requirement protein LtrA